MTQYKAEHIVGSQQDRGDASVQCKKSVFRIAIRERVSVASCTQGEVNQDNSEQDRSDAAPCAGVNSMVKLLRAHGGCLGRDRR